MAKNQGIPMISPDGNFIFCTGCRINDHSSGSDMWPAGGYEVILERAGDSPIVLEEHSWTSWNPNADGPDPRPRFEKMRDAVVAELAKAAVMSKPKVIDLRKLDVFKKKKR